MKHTWIETSHKDLFKCKCGLVRYKASKQLKFRKDIKALELDPVPLYVYAMSYNVGMRERVTFRQWKYSHGPCPILQRAEPVPRVNPVEAFLEGNDLMANREIEEYVRALNARADAIF